MTDLLNQLGDDWHTPHVYAKLILSVLPDTKHLQEIEDCLTGIYVDSHYEYKLYKSKSKYTIYDNELDMCHFRQKEIKEQQKREEEAFENLLKKLKEIQAQLPDHRDEMVEQEEEEEEEAEVEEVVVHKSQQPKGAQPKAKGGKTSKEALLAEKANLQKLQKQFTTTKTCMATSQDKLVNLQMEFDELDTKILAYKGYQQAGWYYLDRMRTLVVSYEKTKDIQELIRSLDAMLGEYHEMRRRAAPKGVCSGEKNLCKTHYLPLSPKKFTEKGEPYNFRCSMYPVA